MKIARVFPSKTSFTPDDKDSYGFGEPPLLLPMDYDEIHISVTFTWDLKHINWLEKQWSVVAPVKVGGPAVKMEPDDYFQPGMYLKKGITITSRGCPNICRFCSVKRDLIELEIKEGNIIQDNNILACSGRHLENVFEMLKGQKMISFSGGLDVFRITEKIVENLRGLKIDQLFISYDRKGQISALKGAIRILRKYFPLRYIRCYVLIGYNGDTIEEAKERLLSVYNLGALPFAMLYRKNDGNRNQKGLDWMQLQRLWTRPALYKKLIKEEL